MNSHEFMAIQKLQLGGREGERERGKERKQERGRDRKRREKNKI